MTEDLLNQYAEEIKNNGLDVEIVDNDLLITTTVESYPIKLRCVLGEHFPYEIPKVFIENPYKDILPKMPHLITDNSICIFDKGKVIPNFKNPSKLIVDTVMAALKILADGIKGNNKKDYIDELLEYWDVKSQIHCNTLLNCLEGIKDIFWYISDNSLFAADTKDKLFRIAKLKAPEDENNFKPGMVITVDASNISEIPKKDIDIIRIVKNYSQQYTQYNSFLQQNSNTNVLVILNMISSSENMMIGWIHKAALIIPHGFRKKHVDISVRYSIKENNNGTAVSIIDCSQKRLFTRGGDGSNFLVNKATVIGCGSVGSYIIETLKYHGTEVFNLVDYDILEVENIARHTVGYFWCGIPKVIALQYQLENFNPNIVCHAFTNNAHYFLENQQCIINDSDIIVIAVADITVEHHVNQLLLDGKINKPILIMWVEPYLLGAHAIYIQKKQDLFDEIFDANTFEFTHTVVKNVDDFYKREAGCQSTYVPYSGMELHQFVNRTITHIFCECMSKKGNYLITWLGNIKTAEQLHAKISAEYQNRESYTIISRRID